MLRTTEEIEERLEEELHYAAVAGRGMEHDRHYRAALALEKVLDLYEMDGGEEKVFNHIRRKILAYHSGDKDTVLDAVNREGDRLHDLETEVLIWSAVPNEAFDNEWPDRKMLRPLEECRERMGVLRKSSKELGGKYNRLIIGFGIVLGILYMIFSFLGGINMVFALPWLAGMIVFVVICYTAGKGWRNKYYGRGYAADAMKEVLAFANSPGGERGFIELLDQLLGMRGTVKNQYTRLDEWKMATDARIRAYSWAASPDESGRGNFLDNDASGNRV